jgi:putative transposase
MRYTLEPLPIGTVYGRRQPIRQRMGNAAMGELLLVIDDPARGQQDLRTRDKARANVFDYIERFYNPRRSHSTIDYLSPMEFKKQAGFA